MPITSTQHLPYDTAIILVGVGAPVQLYDHLTACLQEQLPDLSFHLINWWECDDFGQSLISQAINHTRTIIISHSAGGVIAMQTLVQSSAYVKRIVMLDTHALSNMSVIPSADRMLEVILKHTDPAIKNQVIQAYQAVIHDSRKFDLSLRYAMNWANTKLQETGSVIKNLPNHTALHVGFTDSTYKILDDQHTAEQRAFWGQYHIDNQFLLMNHFDFLEEDNAKAVAQTTIAWLNQHVVVA